MAQLGAIIGILVYVLHSVRYGGWVIDDAGISIAYAKNMISGVGLVAQPGAPRVEGFSNPLWTFLLAFLPVERPPLIVPAIKVTSVCLVYGAMLQVTSIARRMTQSDRLAVVLSLAVNVTCALNPAFVIWTSSGLENPLYVLLVLLSCRWSIALAGAAESEARRDALGAGGLAGLVALTRPEGLLYGGVTAAACILHPGKRSERFGLLLRVSAAFLVVFGSYLLFRVVYFGDVVPNTYHAKPGASLWGGIGFLTGAPGFVALVQLFRSEFGPMVVLAVALFLGYPIYAVARDRGPGSRARFVTWLALACSVVSFLSLPPDWMPEYRFATPFFPLALIHVFGAVDYVLTRAFPGVTAGTRVAVMALLFVAVAGGTSSEFWSRSNAFVRNPTLPMEVVASQAEQFDAMAKELGIRDASILSPDIGGLLVFSRARVVDLAGLIDKRVGTLIHRDARTLREHVLGVVKPTFVHVHGYWAGAIDLHADPRFRRDYEAITEYPTLRKRQRDVLGGDYVRKDALPGGVMTGDLRRRLADIRPAGSMESMEAFPLLSTACPARCGASGSVPRS